ncbi:Uncharacterised protein [Porphyromonas endodontalis]|nr:Uncharacterised protein [Porphyromonas endodontalis]
MGIKSRFLCLIVLLLGSILKVEAQETLTKEQLNDSTYTSRLDGVYFLVDRTQRAILSFKKGKKHGQWVTFDRDLSLWVKTFENGKRQGLFVSSTIYEGVFGYYDNDQKEGYWYEEDDEKREEGNYHKGQRTGVWKCDNYSEGSLWTGSYKRGLKDGVWVCIRGSGRVIVKEVFRMGVLESRVTFED